LVTRSPSCLSKLSGFVQITTAAFDPARAEREP
jgi:hypothetical protein